MTSSLMTGAGATGELDDQGLVNTAAGPAEMARGAEGAADPSEDRKGQGLG